MEGKDTTRHYSLERNSVYEEGGKITYLREWNNRLYLNIRQISTYSNDLTVFRKEGISMNEHEFECFIAVYKEIKNFILERFSVNNQNCQDQDRVFFIGDTMIVNCIRTIDPFQTMDFRRIEKSESGENIHGNGITLKGNEIRRFLNYFSSLKKDFNRLRYEKTMKRTRNSMNSLANQIEYKNLYDTVL